MVVEKEEDLHRTIQIAAIPIAVTMTPNTIFVMRSGIRDMLGVNEDASASLWLY